MPKFRSLYPDYKELEEDVLLKKAYSNAGLAYTVIRPWSVVGQKLALAFGPPIAVFALGLSFMWALAGFAGKTTTDL